VRASLWVTAWEVSAAFLVALPTGLLLGFTLAEVPVLGALFRPLVNFLFGVPKSIFLPVFILIFGVSIPQKIAFGVFTTVFVLIMGGIAAVQSVPRELITVSRVYGASRGQIIREIYLPAMAPILLESARLGMVFNITAVLLCEIYGARDGIGYRIAAWGENLQMPQLYAALVIVAAAAVAVNEALRAVETRLGAWRQRT
jgi:ABC-type nitrate/sulfonate/bicarbonate transport system permease component